MVTVLPHSAGVNFAISLKTRSLLSNLKGQGAEQSYFPLRIVF